MKYQVIGWIFLTFLLTACRVKLANLPEVDSPFRLTTEEQLKDEIRAQEIDHFYLQGEEGFFEGQAGIQIYYKAFRSGTAETPAILISSGRTEAAVKYKELIFDLCSNGYAVYILDHRGQGLSGRMTEDRDLGYIDSFQYYVDDMKFFYDQQVQAGNHEEVFLLAHSMGGAIGMTYLEQHPGDFKAAAFSSPMLGLVAPTCLAAKILAGDTPTYALGQHPYDENEQSFEKNELTGSAIRYHRMNAAFAEEPKARLGGASYQWIHQSCLQFDYMMNHVDLLETPFILFSAENEQIVDPRAHQDFFAKAQKLGKTCQAYLIADACHELLIERDEARSRVIHQVLEFYKGVH